MTGAGIYNFYQMRSRNWAIDGSIRLRALGSFAHLINLNGIGGVGKTTLVLEAAYRCLAANSNKSVFLYFNLSKN